MESSRRLLTILSELETNLAELEQKQAEGQSTSKFKSLETLVNYHKEMQALQQEQEILEKIRPVLTREIELALQQEQAAMCRHKAAATSKEIRKAVAQFQKTENCSIEQTRVLMQLSRLNGGK